MSSTLDKDEQTLATERYEPALSGHYNDLFHALVIRMGNTLPSNRAEIIKAEMARVSEEENQNDVEALRYVAALSVLVDLSLQGWAFDVHGNELTLKMETDNVDDKQRIRYRLSAERNAQFKSESVSAFIKQMETIKNYKGTGISVRNLIGDKNQLLAFIRAGERVCDPYIQLVTNKRDDFTGYKLSDIWRYFRYTWSIPYKTMPGRNLFYLVRDRLQPYHPVIGIFALGNSVLNAEEALTLIQRVNDVDKEERMAQIRSCRSRDIDSYNEKNPTNRMKRLVIIIDEYADLIQTAEMQGNRKEFEKFLSMLAQKVRSLGIHMIIATQRPSANIVTGVLKANIPYRISFRLPSHTDSQTILDMSGAENLLGKGDMLLVTESDTIRMQGLYISEAELESFISEL